MIDNLKFLFQYLNRIDIKIDQNEFAFQVQSHPDFPSLLSIVDTLNFFNIPNGAIRVPILNLDLLPNHFVTLLKEEGKEPQLYNIEKKGDSYYYFNKNKIELIPRSLLEARWSEVVLLAEKSKIKGLSIKNNFFYILAMLCLVLFFIVISKFEIRFTLFFILPLLGIVFSIIALKDLFGVKSELANKFCNFTISNSCNDVVGSKKWKIFELINFSDLSIFLFTSQFLGLLLFLPSENRVDFFSIQSILLLASIPIIFLSLYYQKFVEHKWCPVCLVIITIVLFELGYILLVTNFIINISFSSIALFGLVFFSVSLIWIILKKLLTSQKELQEFQVKSNRFIRNYEIFKNRLLNERKVNFPEVPITLGNTEANLIITLISSPFCGYCKNIHELLEDILRKNSKNLQVQIILKTDLKQGNDESKKLFRSLYKIYFNDKKIFTTALKFWYDNPNSKNWFNIYNLIIKDSFDEIIEEHNDWCKANEISYTPAIFINGYEYPKLYERENLEYFINELIEDNF